ncbi:MAG: hypothetical protein UX10_C0005G0027 [Candidatus Magasanikbacteria bacterium GW2011_GWA2_45_39]|uniref:Uncharacterized protein n=1 Tax=Candidatus Magasanikbacteria bacterium GW2011_GWA2_45_39 TaxID=1619041 RepID=A0A0G1MHH2_9BACT|nr:MAG: hypothetical protein UX10_C0005G0027 [Candidatus Magasanikbacteria bacterium GW2011_GWA2_45_39]
MLEHGIGDGDGLGVHGSCDDVLTIHVERDALHGAIVEVDRGPLLRVVVGVDAIHAGHRSAETLETLPVAVLLPCPERVLLDAEHGVVGGEHAEVLEGVAGVDDITVRIHEQRGALEVLRRREVEVGDRLGPVHELGHEVRADLAREPDHVRVIDLAVRDQERLAGLLVVGDVAHVQELLGVHRA